MNVKLSSLPAYFTALLLTMVTPAVVTACTCMSMPSTCNTTWKSGEVIFLGTVTKKVPSETRQRIGDQEYVGYRRNAFHFSVSESFRGGVNAAQEIVVHTGAGGGDCGYPFIVGTTYLVYASTHNNQLTTDICAQTAPQVLMGGVLRELRAARDRHSLAVLFGTIGIWPRGAGYEDLVESKPLADIQVRAIGSTPLEYSTETDRHGAYSFESLPPDTYRIQVDLPKGLSTWQQNMDKPLTVQLGLTEAASGCRADLFARPDGRISGVVMDTTGRPLAGFVTIRPADPAEAEAARRRGGLPGYTTEDGKFSLWQIPPGKYQLLFYPKIGEQISFARGATTSEVIDLAFGQHIENFRFKVSVPNEPR